MFRAFRTKVNDGTIEIWASDWPWFMYNNNEPLDPEEKDKGLCRGYILVWVNIFWLAKTFLPSSRWQVFRHIFTGPSSAITGTRSGTKPSKSQIRGLTQVTGRTIAYAAVQVSVVFYTQENCTFLIIVRHGGLFVPRKNGHDLTATSIMRLFIITL